MLDGSRSMDACGDGHAVPDFTSLHNFGGVGRAARRTAGTRSLAPSRTAAGTCGSPPVPSWCVASTDMALVPSGRRDSELATSYGGRRWPRWRSVSSSSRAARQSRWHTCGACNRCGRAGSGQRGRRVVVQCRPRPIRASRLSTRAAQRAWLLGAPRAHPGRVVPQRGGRQVGAGPRHADVPGAEVGHFVHVDPAVPWAVMQRGSCCSAREGCRPRARAVAQPASGRGWRASRARQCLPAGRRPARAHQIPSQGTRPWWRSSRDAK